MNTSFYKCCAVPTCKSTSISTPQKLFINVPKSAQIRRKWLKLAGRHPASLRPTSTSHFCEDHFDLPNDMENYVEYTIMGEVSRITMKPGCLPTKFAGQLTRASTSSDQCQPDKRQKLALKNECKEEIQEAAFEQSENLNVEIIIGLSSDVCQPEKRQELALKNEYKQEIKETAFEQSENLNIEVILGL